MDLFLKAKANFYNNTEKWNEFANQTSNIDSFCSSYVWIEPSFRVFYKRTNLFISETEKSALILCQGNDEKRGRYYEPLENSWKLTSPFIGENIEQDLCSLLEPLMHTEWNTISLSGLYPSLVSKIKKCFLEIENIQIEDDKIGYRYLASLEGGTEGFYSRRSRKFRRNMRKNKEKTQKANIQFKIFKLTSPNEVLSYFERAIDIEKRSWKAAKDTGMNSPFMYRFSKRVLLNAVNYMGACGILAFDGKKEVGFIYGAIFQNIFRGLQMSYDNDYRALGLGNMLQHNMLDYLANNNVEGYDLGSEVAYKSRWVEKKLAVPSIIIRRNL